ncbi:pantothenate synthetase [bacterium BMS3Abin01]|nr:pantothenate synthetase [bacterium BMS3Abin01]
MVYFRPPAPKSGIPRGTGTEVGVLSVQADNIRSQSLVVACHINDARRQAEMARAAGATIGLVPTMGFFHEGHLSLMRAAREECGYTAVSIFVNPAQFVDGEDLVSYPRDMERDLELAAAEGMDLVFAPSADAMYGGGQGTMVEPGRAATGLCGRSRPGHFRGVVTVVAKLFNIIRPDAAYFGQKDAQQAAVVRAMAEDLDYHTRIRVMPTVREPDGLAMSSRNSYLSTDQRRQATVLYRALTRARRAALAGESSVSVLLESMEQDIGEQPAVELEYARIVDPETMQPLAELGKRSLAVVAARVGRARLTDNIFMEGRR